MSNIEKLQYIKSLKNMEQHDEPKTQQLKVVLPIKLLHGSRTTKEEGTKVLKITCKSSQIKEYNKYTKLISIITKINYLKKKY